MNYAMTTGNESYNCWLLKFDKFVKIRFTNIFPYKYTISLFMTPFGKIFLEILCFYHVPAIIVLALKNLNLNLLLDIHIFGLEFYIEM